MKLKNPFKRVKNETSVVDDIVLRALLNSEEIDRKKAMSLPCVFKAVDFICDTIAMIPIKLYQEKDGKVEEVNDYRVNLLNDDTKDTLNGFQFKRNLTEDYLLGKGGYAYINRQRNKIISLNYVEDSKIQILKNNDPIFKKIAFMVNGKRYYDFEFLKIVKNTNDGGSGNSVINQVSKALETAYQTLLYQLTILKTGGNKRGFLKSENPLSKEAMDELKDGWKKLYSTNESNVVVLNNGVDFKEASNSSVEMQLNENKNTLNNEIDGIFHIKGNYNDTFKEAIMPIISAIECALNKDLLLEREKESFYFAFDLKEILKGTLKERFEAYRIAKQTGWITTNEIRYLENYDAIEGMDIIEMNLGSVIYDTKSHTYYTPNTDSTKDFKGGDKNE